MPDDRLEFDAPALNDVASYFCTGGTTGMPKIAVRTHRTEVANAIQVGAMFGELGAEQPLFCGLPLFHVNAQIATGLMPWSRGGHVVLATPQGYRTQGLIQEFWRIAAHYRLFSFSAVPTIYAALLQSPREGLDLASLKFGLCGAAPMPFELISRFERETGIRILEGYGLTEGGCVSTLNPPGGSPRPGSIGIRPPWQDLRVMVLDGGSYVREAAPGETGTIAITGPNLFEGYLNDAHNRGLWIEVPGLPSRWLNTGDLGRVDAEGYVWLTGRSKELIIRGGHNIDPKMIEEPMHEHPVRGSGRGSRAARCACGRSPRRVCAAAPRHECHRRRRCSSGDASTLPNAQRGRDRWWCCRPCRPRPSASSSSPGSSRWRFAPWWPRKRRRQARH